MSMLFLEILLTLLAGTYLLGLLIIWSYELRKIRIYRLVNQQVKFLGQLGLSMAVFHAKLFKLEQDYRQWLRKIENRQEFILEKVLFLRKVSAKNKYGELNFSQS